MIADSGEFNVFSPQCLAAYPSCAETSFIILIKHTRSTHSILKLDFIARKEGTNKEGQKHNPGRCV